MTLYCKSYGDDHMIKKRPDPVILLLILLLPFYLYIAWQIPYAGDDWDWGLDVGLQHLLTADINSRYTGNFLVVLMTRSKPLQAVLMGASYLGIPWLMASLTVNRSREPRIFLLCFLAANCLILSMNPHIWRQTWGWIAGFANYGFSILGLLLCLFPAMRLFREPPTPCRSSAVRDLGLFLLTFLNQLFLENLTLYMVLYTGALCLISLFRERTIRRQYLALFAGALAGLCVMFSSSIYPVLFSSGTSTTAFRTLSFEKNTGITGLITGCILSFMEKASWIWEKNVVLCCTISLVLTALLWTKKVHPFLRWSLSALNLLSVLYFVLCGHLAYGKLELFYRGLLGKAELIVNLGYFFLVAVETVVLYRHRRWDMAKLLCLWISAPGVILPLSFLTIEGARFYATSNCFLTVFVLFLAADLFRLLPVSGRRWASLALVTVFAVLCVHLFGIFYQASLCTRQREAILADARITGTKEVTLPTYPPEVTPYIWEADALDARQIFFRQFHGLHWDVVLHFVPET